MSESLTSDLFISSRLNIFLKPKEVKREITDRRKHDLRVGTDYFSVDWLIDSALIIVLFVICLYSSITGGVTPLKL